VRVGLNLLWLRPGRVGGSETYVGRLLAGLAALASPDLDYEVFALPALGPTPFPTATAAVARGARPLRIAAESTWLAARTRRFDLVHHLGGTVPAVRTAPAAVLVHDLQYTAFPEHFSAVKRAYLAAAVPAAARAAVLVTTPSEFVRSTVVDGLGVAPERVTAVPIGVTGPGGPEPGEADPVVAASVRRRLGVAGPFVLYPAVTWPHKDHVTLVRALALLPAGERPTLVLTGGEGGAEGALAVEVDRLRLRRWVRRPGRVAPAHLDVLYREAAAVAFPSRYEGFGAPAVEAMARGVPVVAADATALPEVVGDAGLLVPPGDAGAWAAAIGRVLSDGALRARLAAAGPARAARFSAVESATRQEAAYRGVTAP
jgi:glycosyltransferase involved in cell wall biosynthesis